MNRPGSPLPLVVYVEDDENDAFLFRHAWRKAGVPNPLTVFADGQRPIDYLSGAGEYADRSRHPLPELLLLDLNLPLRSGLDVLGWVRERRELAALPVVILSSSNQAKDVERASDLGATAYFVKPTNVVQLVDLVANFRERWLS